MKTKRVEIRFSDDEAAGLAAQAEAVGLEKSEYVRRLVAGAEVRAATVIPPVNRSTYAELARVGNNLNQLAKAANAAGAPAALAENLQALRTVVQRLQCEVLGAAG